MAARISLTFSGRMREPFWAEIWATKQPSKRARTRYLERMVFSWATDYTDFTDGLIGVIREIYGCTFYRAFAKIRPCNFLLLIGAPEDLRMNRTSTRFFTFERRPACGRSEGAPFESDQLK
jgi:hypothetical protein